MGKAIGEILPIAIGVALSPLPVVAVILVLFTPRAKTNGLAFLAGWAGGMLLVGGAVLLFSNATDAASDEGGESTLSGVLKLVLGVLLLLLAVRSWRSRPAEGVEPELPRWMSALDSLHLREVLRDRGGALVGEPEEPRAPRRRDGVDLGGRAHRGRSIVVLFFVGLASLSLAVPVGLHFGPGERAAAMLGPAKGWLALNNAAVMAILFLVFGAKLLGDGIRILS